MDFRIIKTVIAREYSTRVKKKSFLVTTFLVPILFAAMMVVVMYIMGNTKERKQDVAVVDQSGIVMPHLTDTERITYEDYSSEAPDDLKGRLASIGKDVLVVISSLDTVAKTVTVQTYSKDPLGVEFTSGLRNKVDDAVEEYRVRQYGIENLSQIMEEVKSHVSVTEYTLDESGKETLSESSIYMIVSMVLGIIIWMFITMFGAQVMSSVIEEKSSRVVEVLISSVKAVDLMFGKIIGVALVALTQFLLWIVLTVILTGVASAFMGKDMLKDLQNNPQMMGQTVNMPGGTDLGTVALGEAVDTAEVVPGQINQMQKVVGTLANIPWVKLIVSFLVFFILGYLLYASMYAAVGSAVENEGDASQLQLPLTIPLMIAYFIILMAFQNPDSPVVVWGSIIPFTSPIVMLARIPYGVPAWQLILSVVLLFLTFLGCAWASAKIYKAGILMFGKKSTFKDLWKWLKQS
ncbi:MAG: ABC transporter permease [Bacteroidales bacterium]|jgi:ABC-2 type transport system permease protein|nr:ABC transporter permease [Bacteroidales bacterium]MBQ2197189.1 ABC transporter permease [Bacteroidales bacterium]